jgi:tetratricopeptide (TPR) repeat protein
MANPFSQHAHPAATPWTPAPAGQPPDWSQIDQLLASAAEFERNGSSWQAINAYRQAIQLDPQNHRALLSFARMKHRARDFAGAVSLYQQLLRNYPNDPLALNDLGLCYARMGDAARAIGALQLAVQHRPDSKRYRNNLAVVLVEANQWDAALQTLIPIHGPAVANYNVAWLLARQGQNDRSISYLNAALLADPSFRPAIDLLAQVEPTGSRIASTPTETGSVDQAPVIQLRGGILSESAKTSPAVYQTDAGELPPNLNDYRIPGMPRVE